MYRDIDAAGILGTSSAALRKEFRDRHISMDAYGKLERGRFDPYFPSKEILARFREIARNLGDPDAFRMARPDVRGEQREFRGLQLAGKFSEGGRVGYALGSPNPNTETEIKNLVALLRSVRNELKKLRLDDEFDIEIGDYVETQDPQAAISSQMETPQVNPALVEPLKNNMNVMQTGLTPTEHALLSPEEQGIRLRQRGIG